MAELTLDDASKQFGDAMRQWRKENGIAQEKAGLSIGVDRVQWQKWENGTADGKNPTLESLLKIAGVMNRSFSDLADLIWPSGSEFRYDGPAIKDQRK